MNGKTTKFSVIKLNGKGLVSGSTNCVNSATRNLFHNINYFMQCYHSRRQYFKLQGFLCLKRRFPQFLSISLHCTGKNLINKKLFYFNNEYFRSLITNNGLIDIANKCNKFSQQNIVC